MRIKGYTKIISNRFLSYSESMIASLFSGDNISYPPIFIVGAPRSGTTLLYQILVKSYEVGYLSNLDAAFYGLPALSAGFTKDLRRKSLSGDFNSCYGKTKGWHDPSECGEYWNRFFRNENGHQVPKNKKSMQRLSQSVRLLTRIFNKSIVFKNVFNVGRLPYIQETFPEARFVWIQRNPFDNACSILKGKKYELGQYTGVWSFAPPNLYDVTMLSPAMSAYMQVMECNRMVDAFFKEIPKSHIAMTTYEELCGDPINTIANIRESMDLDLNESGLSDLPKSFKISSSENNIPKDIIADLKNIINSNL